MAIARFHELRGQNSALILVKANEFVFGFTPAYVPRAPFMQEVPALDDEGNPILDEDGNPTTVMELKPEFVQGYEFKIPDGFKFVPIVDENGEPRTTKTGETLHQLAY